MTSAENTTDRRPAITRVVLMGMTAVTAGLGALVAVFPPTRAVAGAVPAAVGVTMTVLTFGLGFVPKSGTRPRSWAVTIAGLAAGALTITIPALAEGYRVVVEWLLSSLIYGPATSRAAAAAVPVVWLLLFGLAAPWRWFRIASSAIAGLTAVILLLIVPPAIESMVTSIERSYWSAAWEARGSKLADVRLVDIDGVERSLAEFEGKLLLINVWRTW